MDQRNFPHTDGMSSFWRSKLDTLDNHRSTAKLPAEVDVLIIGGGYAGASTAHHLLAHMEPEKESSILILEARQACSGATGRNGGHLKPDPYRSIAQLAAEYGIEAATEVASFEAEHVDVLKEFTEREGIDCDFVITRSIDVHLDKELCSELKAGYDHLVRAGVRTAQKTHYIHEKAAEGISGVKGAKGCFSYTAAHLWPYKLVMAMLSRAIKRGVNLQTHTPVKKVLEQRDSSGRWTVETDRGFVKARWIVFATNAYTSAILPQYKDKIVPVRGICSRIVCDDAAPLLQCSCTLRRNRWDYDYLIPKTDGSIIVGGARSAFIQDQSSWYDNVDDSQLIDAAKSYFDGYMQRNFRGWEQSGAKTDKIWTGIMGYSIDAMPHIGEVPGKPGQMILAGFTGHGMPVAFLAAKGIAQMIITGASFRQTSIPRLYQTSQARLDSKMNRILAALRDVKIDGARL